MVLCHYFKTKAEAKAFHEGMEFVNDSSVVPLQIKKTSRGYAALFEDRDADPRDYDDDPPVAKARAPKKKAPKAGLSPWVADSLRRSLRANTSMFQPADSKK